MVLTKAALYYMSEIPAIPIDATFVQTKSMKYLDGDCVLV